MKTKQFQYEVQSYQENCVRNIVNLFGKLTQRESFSKALQEHHQNQNYPFPVQDTNNIDILMETGTGKTFTYIKTIFELNRNFGYKKFIVLVPSVSIREGTKVNFDDTKDYFKSLYANEREKEIETFVYEAGNISTIKQFINTSHLSVLILTPSSFDKDTNLLNKPLEYDIQTPDLFLQNQTPPKSYLDCLKRLNPIIIMDEPHRFEGDAFKKYFKGFTNYYLRFGATFPTKKDSLVLSNVAYVLDSISSFRQSLVKKIVVYSHGSVQNTDTLIKIQDKKAIVKTLVNGVFVERELSIGSIFNGKSIKKIHKDSIVLADDTIEKIDYSLSDESLRAMIRKTIQIHFEKEQFLFEKGIKTLTLFFMQNDISLYRGEKPKIKMMFEEEYLKEREKILNQLDKTSTYYQYLQNDFDSENHLQVHKGYFSGDKGSTDEKIKAGVEEILKEKKKLLSFESPTRFIFSIWALQEGWDNPNVFTICKLSNQGSDISKLQQIGRGLRICVNQNLERQTLKFFHMDQELFWKINNLDVVVPSEEQGFVEAIQNEILSNSFLVSSTFTAVELKKILKEKGNLEDKLAHNLFKTLEERELILFKETVDGMDVYEKSPSFAQRLKEIGLPENQKKILETIFASDLNNYVQKAEDKKEKKKLRIKQTHLQEFQNLWSAINQDAFYVLDTLSEEQENTLIQNMKAEIEKLSIHETLFQITRADLQFKEELTITKKIVDSISYKNEVNYLELVRSLSNSTKTPLSFVVKLFNSLSLEFKKKMISNDLQQIQKEMIKIIQKHLIELLVAKVRYDGIFGKALPNVFSNSLEPGSTGRFQKEIDKDFSLKAKWVFENVIEYD
ncbi:MAG: DEAD/DEAH box helicase family protein, partial [Leptospiraceae bacterium]|nr:DEAD/DEAH box helicase family protein [Leptospiraceae bacterium]